MRSETTIRRLRARADYRSATVPIQMLCRIGLVSGCVHDSRSVSPLKHHGAFYRDVSAGNVPGMCGAFHLVDGLGRCEIFYRYYGIAEAHCYKPSSTKCGLILIGCHWEHP